VTWALYLARLFIVGRRPAKVQPDSMIRFLQKDSRLIKAVFIIIISVACITMVITLVPGIFQNSTDSGANYATIRGGNIFSRIFGSSVVVTQQEVHSAAERIIQQRGWPQQALPFILPQAGQGLIQRAILLSEANRLGLQVGNEAVRKFLHTGPIGAAIFPNGKYIGDQRYAELIEDNFGLSTDQFEAEIKKELEEARLRDLITGSVAVSDGEVKSNYVKSATKISFTYAVLSAETVAQTINPSDAELQKFFKDHADLYATAIPEARTLQYLVVNGDNLPGGVPAVTDAEEQAFYGAHQSDFKVDEQVKVRHILIKVAPNATPAEDAAAKAKAQGVLDQLKKDNGADFAALAKANSDDPGSKDQGGELGFIKRGATVPAFESAAFALQPGQISGLVKTQFGYHIIQCEAKQAAHAQSFDEVKPKILATLTEQKEQGAEKTFADALSSEAGKNGLQSTASAHHLQLQTASNVAQTGFLPGVADASKLLTAAFSASKGAAPQIANTGDGFAIFQVQSITAAHAPDFATYKDHILSDYRTQQTPILLSQKGTELADKAHSENSLAQAAKELGATIKTSDPVALDGQVPDIGALATAAPQLFSLNPGQISGPIHGDNTSVVAQITAKQAPSTEEIAQHLPQAKEALLDQNRQEAFAIFASNLVQEYQKQRRIAVTKSAQTPDQAPVQPGS
jgi:peptidyl-prolyl cis-trans isomerase D